MKNVLVAVSNKFAVKMVTDRLLSIGAVWDHTVLPLDTVISNQSWNFVGVNPQGSIYFTDFVSGITEIVETVDVMTASDVADLVC